MSDNPVDPQLKPTLTVKQVGNKVYAINGLPRRSQEVIFPAEQISVDDSGFTTISGDDVQDVFNDIDIHITNISGQLVEDVVFTYSDQTISGEKTFVDDLMVASNLLPSGSTVNIGASGFEFQEAYIEAIHADEILIEGSPGLKLGHDGVRGFVDSSQDNDIDLRRNGVPFLRLEDGLANFNQDVAILGNFLVSGSTTTLNTEQLLVEDNLVTLNSTHSGAPVLDAGIEINRGSQANALVLWDEFNNYWTAGISGALDRITLLADLLSASGTLQTDINTRATFAQLVAASGVLQTDINSRVLRAGDTMTGFLTLNANPTASGHASTKLYTDNQDALKLSLTGGTLTGDVLASTTSVDLGTSGSQFGTVYANIHRGPSDVFLIADTDDVFVRANDDIVFQTNVATPTNMWIMDAGVSAFYPGTNNEFAIGTTSRHLSGIFTTGVASTHANGLSLISSNTIDISANTTLTLASTGATTATASSYSLDTTGAISLDAVGNVDIESNGNISIYTNDTDGADNGAIHIGISAGANYARGGFLAIHGNEHAQDGDTRLGAGETGSIQLYAGSIASANALRWQISTNGQLSNFNTNINEAKLIVNASDGSFTSAVQRITVDRTASTAFQFLQLTADDDGTPDNKLFVRGDGQTFADGAYNGTGADYAEYFELKVGEEIPPLGSTVVLDTDRVRVYIPGVDSLEDIIGVIRAKGASSTIGNHPINWHNRYLKTVLGEYLLDENGERIQNPEFDPEQEYIYRSEREEWVLVGLLGQVPVLSSASKNPSWKKMKDLNESVELWLIK